MSVVALGRELFHLRRLNRIGWRYINAIPFTREDGLIPLTRFFLDPPKFFAINSSAYQGISLHATTRVEDFSITARLESAESLAQSNEILAFDIDAFREGLDGTHYENHEIREATEKLHNAARNYFEGSISDSYRKFLLGESYE